MHAPAALAATSAPTARAAARTPMSPGLRRTILAVCALLWLSGCLWLVLHFGFPQAGEFGALPNPWEAAVLRAHGAIAVAGVFLLGWVAGGHLPTRWGAAYNRGSGLLLGASALLLVVSGYALYYSTGVLHESAARIHELLGVASLAAALAHWWHSAATRAARDAAQR